MSENEDGAEADGIVGPEDSEQQQLQGPSETAGRPFDFKASHLTGALDELEEQRLELWRRVRCLQDWNYRPEPSRLDLSEVKGTLKELVKETDLKEARLKVASITKGLEAEAKMLEETAASLKGYLSKWCPEKADRETSAFEQRARQLRALSPQASKLLGEDSVETSVRELLAEFRELEKAELTKPLSTLDERDFIKLADNPPDSGKVLLLLRSILREQSDQHSKARRLFLDKLEETSIDKTRESILTRMAWLQKLSSEPVRNHLDINSPLIPYLDYLDVNRDLERDLADWDACTRSPTFKNCNERLKELTKGTLDSESGGTLLKDLATASLNTEWPPKGSPKTSFPIDVSAYFVRKGFRVIAFTALAFCIFLGGLLGFIYQGRSADAGLGETIAVLLTSFLAVLGAVQFGLYLAERHLRIYKPALLLPRAKKMPTALTNVLIQIEKEAYAHGWTPPDRSDTALLSELEEANDKLRAQSSLSDKGHVVGALIDNYLQDRKLSEPTLRSQSLLLEVGLLDINDVNDNEWPFITRVMGAAYRVVKLHSDEHEELKDYLKEDTPEARLVGTLVETEVALLNEQICRLEESEHESMVALLKGGRDKLLGWIVPFRRLQRRNTIEQAIREFRSMAERSGEWGLDFMAGAVGIVATGVGLAILLFSVLSAGLSGNGLAPGMSEIRSRLTKLQRLVDVFPSQDDFLEFRVLQDLGDVGSWGDAHLSWKKLKPSTVHKKKHEDDWQSAVSVKSLLVHLDDLRLNADGRKAMMTARLQSLQEKAAAVAKEDAAAQTLLYILLVLGFIILFSILVYTISMTIRFARYHIILRNFYEGRASALSVLLDTGQGLDGSVSNFADVLGAESLDLGAIAMTPFEEAIAAVERMLQLDSGQERN